MLWGCERSAPEPLAYLSCPDCKGLGKPCPLCGGEDQTCSHCHGRYKACPTCGGKNEIPLMRCPVLYMTDEMVLFVQAWSLYRQGILPEPGGMGDQAAVFIDGCLRLDLEIKRLAEQSED